ncbi:MAG: aldo/keto reductase [Pseudomonadota bacterium]
MTDSPSSQRGKPTVGPNRRGFVRRLAALGAGAQALATSGSLHAASEAGKAHAQEPAAWPKMAYRKLGNTNFNASRLVFGCGAALSRKPRDELLHTAFDAGINVFDVGYKHYYNDAEKHLAPFLKTHRDRIFLISKAAVPSEVGPNAAFPVAEAKRAAAGWLKYLDESLREMQVDHVDAYYLMASYNPQVVVSEEILGAFERAKRAGKVSHLGVSTHRQADKVLAAITESGVYSLAMIAVTPSGWYDWETREVLPDSPPLTGLRPQLDAARAAGIGLIGMKAGRFLAGRRFLGWGNPDAFDEHYDERFMQAPLSTFQRSYAYVLGHGLDAVNADMQSLVHLRENHVAAATSNLFFDNGATA